MVLDGDEAGEQAAEGIAHRLRIAVFQVGVVSLDGVQPDTMGPMNCERYSHNP